MAQTISTGTFCQSEWIVDADITKGTHTTIASALTSASSGDVIFIRPGAYTENLTLKAGVDLVAYSSDYVNGQVEIIGKLSYSAAGTVNLYNLKLTTNSDYFLEVTGANDSVMNIRNCYLNVTNNNGINITSTGASREIIFDGCYGNITTTLISYFTVGGSGGGYLGQGVFFKDCHLRNTGNSTTASTATSTIRAESSYFFFPISITAAGLFARHNEFSCNNINTTAITTATSGTIALDHCIISSGTASALSLGAGTAATIYNCDISSSNTNAITGAGSLDYAGLSFSSTSSNINVTTQTLSEEGPSRSVGSSNSGNTNTLTVFNSNNANASSDAAIIASVGGSSGGEAYFSTSKTGTGSWAHGFKAGSSSTYFFSRSTSDSTTPDSGTQIVAINQNGSTTISGQADGSSTAILFQNVNNTASSSVNLALQSAGSTAGDAWIRFQISGAGEYSLGNDNSDSDALCLTNTSTLNGTNYLRVSSSGEFNYPFQPAFMAFLPSTEADVTGDGTVFQIGSVTAMTEVFDQNGDFNTNGTFTAPVTGRYMLVANVLAQQGTAAHSCTFRITTSNATYNFCNNSVMVVGNNGLACSVLADMDAADTATMSFIASGSTKTVDVFGGASDRRTNFSGWLVA